MNQDEIARRLQQGGLKLSFDTNAVVTEGKFTSICENVSRWNVHLRDQGRRDVSLSVCTIMYVEKLFDLKQRFRKTFDIGVILESLQLKGVQVEAFDARHAVEVASRLGEWYQDTKAWHAAKRERCLHCLGLSPVNTLAAGSGRGCGATVDWLIGAHAHAEGAILVSDDKGPEFKNLDRVTLDVLQAALQHLVGVA